MFETLGIGQYYVVVDGLLSIYSAGRFTGIVVQVNDDVTHTIPIYEGYVLSHAVKTNYIGVSDLEDYMNQLLTEAGYSFTTFAELEIVK